MSYTGKSILGKLCAMVLVTGMLALSTVVSFSDSTLTKPLNSWFEAIQTGDADTLEQIVADGATIELKDLGITQTKAEFIASLDQWVELNKDADILTRQLSSGDGEVILEVCYRFTSNEVLNRESFELSGSKIVRSVQEKTSETCTGF